MKTRKELAPEKALRLLFLLFTLAFFCAALLMPDRSYMFKGFLNLLRLPAKTPTNYFSPGYGGFAGTFFNMGCVCLICTALCFLPKAKLNGVTVLAVILTVGFSAWGIHMVNIWFGFFGVALYCLVKKDRLGNHIHTMLFTTGLAPLYSDLMLYYPGADYAGFRWQGFLLALAVGIFVGFFLPAMLPHSPAMHKNYNLYSAALPICLMAFFLRGVLYIVLGADRGGTDVGPIKNEYAGLQFASQTVCNLFCIILFGLCILFALLMGCKIRDYLGLLKDSGYRTDFIDRHGIAVSVMNIGVFGLFILLYYNLVSLLGSNSTVFNGVTFGCIFCMLSTACVGSHPRNIWPIMAGYLAASFLTRWVSLYLLHSDTFALTLDAQAILVGLCFAGGLSPISGRYGRRYGIIAGMLHFCLVTSVPLLHGAFSLYNGGFTSGVTCMLLIPVLEHFCRTKEDRLNAKKPAVKNAKEDAVP